jgi:hypothetical protein
MGNYNRVQLRKVLKYVEPSGIVFVLKVEEKIA